MKNSILVLILLCMSGQASAQDISFTDVGARWFVADTYPNGNLENPSFIQTTTEVFQWCGEEEIDEVMWSRLCVASDSSQQSTQTLQGWVRDSVGWVFFLDTLGNETLIYDFTLEVGDSILSGFHQESFPTQVEYMTALAVDSVFLNGQYHKRIFFDTIQSGIFSWFTDVWIEGIGSIHGPLSPIDPMFYGGEFPARIDLTCYWMENDLVWQNPEFESCYIQLILALHDVPESRLSISPNPSTGIFRIETDRRSTYRIHDLFGRNIQVGQTGGKTDIDLSEHPNGIYLITVETENGVSTLKLIKQ